MTVQLQLVHFSYGKLALGIRVALAGKHYKGEIMKEPIRIALAALIVGLFATSAPLYAQTPDGTTPANEGVCDDLTADGVTNGLYGLCIAFCEAQDHADIFTAITESDYDALLAAAPSGKILENYNKIMTENDPPMPCITRVDAPCPCWDEEEFLNASEAGRSGQQTFNVCRSGTTESYQLFDLSTVTGVAANRFQLADLITCALVDFANGVDRRLDISEAEYVACRDRVKDRQVEFSLVPSSTSFAFPNCFDPQAAQ